MHSTELQKTLFNGYGTSLLSMAIPSLMHFNFYSTAQALRMWEDVMKDQMESSAAIN